MEEMINMLGKISKEDTTFLKHERFMKIKLGKIPFDIESFYTVQELSEKLNNNTKKRVMDIMFESMGKLVNYKHFIIRNVNISLFLALIL